MNKDIVRKYEDIKEGVESLSSQLGEITTMANRELREYGEEAMDEVSTNVKKAVTLTKENPWTTVAVVSLAALAIGLLVSKGHSERK